ncbi:hypothetical protein GDO86_007363 [Hymenochirus boettgeri]|uniref:Natural cytotoxicity triggering receptor 3 n=1 Tax=Hymenochirus boettgeri TaxID=247094 RepID=A0A8T2IYW8_9PIPI|nr:hypothetical protein GDO86_007363 [Hymenochirus boettgeri]
MIGVGLLLILGVVQGSLSQMVHVYQVPEVTSSEGSTVTLHCNYTATNVVNNIGWFTWYRHAVGGPVVSNDSKDFIGRVSVTTQLDFINKRSANIQLHKVNIIDTGMYICEISLLFNQTEKGHGKGTFLNVTGEGLMNIY